MLQRSFPGLFLMTSVLIFPLLLFSSLQTNAQSSKNNFYLAGHIKGMDGNYIFFSYRGLGNERKWDSIFVKNGAFNFKGTITQPAKSLLTILKSNRTSTIDPNVTLPLFIEPTHMHIILRRNHFREAILVGSKSEDEFMELLNKSKTVSKQLDPLINKRNELDEKFAIENSSGSDSLSGIIQKLSKLNHTIGGLQEKEFRIVKSFLEKYPQSYITAYKIVDDIRHFNLAQLKRYYARMPKELRESEYGQELGIDIYKMSKGSPGSVAADFSAKDLEGNRFD